MTMRGTCRYVSTEYGVQYATTRITSPLMRLESPAISLATILQASFHYHSTLIKGAPHFDTDFTGGLVLPDGYLNYDRTITPFIRQIDCQGDERNLTECPYSGSGNRDQCVPVQIRCDGQSLIITSIYFLCNIPCLSLFLKTTSLRAV